MAITTAGSKPTTTTHRPRSRPASPVDRGEQLEVLLEHFLLSVEQAAALLGCKPNAIYHRRSNPAPARHTKLDDAIDNVFYVMTTIETAGLGATEARDWLYARSRYFHGDLPAVRLPLGQDALIIEAARAWIRGLDFDDFVDRIERLGMSADDLRPQHDAA